MALWRTGDTASCFACLITFYSHTFLSGPFLSPTDNHSIVLNVYFGRGASVASSCKLGIVVHVCSLCCYSVTQSCPILCNPVDCSTPGLPVHHHLPELAQTHVHSVSDAIQPTHPLSSPSPPALNLSRNRVFSNELTLCIRWPEYWSFSISPSNEYSGLISFRMDWFDLLSVQGTLQLMPMVASYHSFIL